MAPAQSRDAFGSDEVQIAPRARYLGRSDRDSPAWFAGGTAVSIERARKIADAVLYEGYVLYAYRASSGKNRVRWQFGVLAPREWSDAGGCEHSWSQTECLLEAGRGEFEIAGKVRFLQIQRRIVEELVDGDTDTFHQVESLEAEAELWTGWDEAIEREVDFVESSESSHGERLVEFEFP